METSPTTESRELPKSFGAQLRAAFEAGERRGEYVTGLGEGYRMEPAPAFEEWRASLGDSA